MNPVQFFIEEIDFELQNKKMLRHWINKICANHHVNIDQLNYIYCSDNYLLEINKTYLEHDYYTDIITFDQREDLGANLEADIFISIDRVKENALNQHIEWSHELHRVMAHGLLHLLGHNDKTPEQQSEMRKSEDACLSLLQD